MPINLYYVPWNFCTRWEGENAEKILFTLSRFNVNSTSSYLFSKSILHTFHYFIPYRIFRNLQEQLAHTCILLYRVASDISDSMAILVRTADPKRTNGPYKHVYSNSNPNHFLYTCDQFKGINEWWKSNSGNFMFIFPVREGHRYFAIWNEQVLVRIEDKLRQHSCTLKH